MAPCLSIYSGRETTVVGICADKGFGIFLLVAGRGFDNGFLGEAVLLQGVLDDLVGAEGSRHAGEMPYVVGTLLFGYFPVEKVASLCLFTTDHIFDC